MSPERELLAPGEIAVRLPSEIDEGFLDLMKDASRRDALKWIGAASTLVAASCTRNPEAESESTKMSEITSLRMPTVYLPHGGGPWPFMPRGAFGSATTYDKMSEYLRNLSSALPLEPKALLVVSAHWEESVVTIQTSENPPLLFDYSGFPPETYQVKWPAPGSTTVAARVRALLGDAGIESAEDSSRGFDHGTFVPLSLTYPNPTIPTLQLSLKKGLDPSEHLRIGQALAPLRDEGIFIVGSGMSYHNMSGFFGRVPSSGEDSRVFHDWLKSTVLSDAQAREEALASWSKAPSARACHPREEHLLPLMVVAGAAGESRATVPFEDFLMGVHVLAAHFA